MREKETIQHESFGQIRFSRVSGQIIEEVYQAMINYQVEITD